MMLTNAKRTYMLANFTVEHRAAGWFYWTTYGEKEPKGPYSSESSVCLMVARALKKELVKRDSVHRLSE